jgi:hypothetical protein
MYSPYCTIHEPDRALKNSPVDCFSEGASRRVGKKKQVPDKDPVDPDSFRDEERDGALATGKIAKSIK